MCNSKDRTRTARDNSETFSMANMQPQTPALNQQVWKQLEEYSRTLAGQGNELYIVAGCYGSRRIIGRANKVTVPTRCWKVITVLRRGRDDLARVDAGTRVIAVDMPNRGGIGRDPWQKYITTVDAVEEATGYDLLSEVAEDVQSVVEAGRDPGRDPEPRRAPRRRRRR